MGVIVKLLIAKCRCLSRKSLETIYRSFTLLQLDYVDVIWDNCSVKLSEDLVTEQLVTRNCTLRQGLQLYEKDASGTNVLIIIYHKTVHENTPIYLNEHLPPLVASTNPYHRRRPFQQQVPKRKT